MRMLFDFCFMLVLDITCLRKIKVMKNCLFALFIWASLSFSCQTPPGQSTATGDPRFQTTAPSLLFFKNMRSAYYETQEQPQTRIELYRLRRFATSSSQRPILIPIIANNWLADEAYLFIQPNAFEKGFAEPYTVFWEDDGTAGSRTLHPMDVNQQYEFALEVYERLAKGYALQALCADSTLAPIFDQQEDRLNFMTVVKDYLRLIE